VCQLTREELRLVVPPLAESALVQWQGDEQARGPGEELAALGGEQLREGGGEPRQRGQVFRGKVPGSAQVWQREGGSRSRATSHVSQKAARTGITFAQAMHAGG
jgi:hypothetical protein